MRTVLLFAAMFAALICVGIFQSWNVALAILNLQLISAVMALGVNIQWGYGGIINVGIMGFTALGGVAAVLVSVPPVPEAWGAGGLRMIAAGAAVLAVIVAAVAAYRRLEGRARQAAMFIVIVGGYIVIRVLYDPAVAAIESVDPSRTGYLGGLGLPILLAWIIGGLFAAGVAWVIGKIALGLRSDYLAIATLGISEILVAMMKNEDWLTRGVKNVTGLPRPVPYEVDLQGAAWFAELSARLGQDPVVFSGIFVKLLYAVLFSVVLVIVYWLAERALASPWGRMMRAIRDNRDAAEAMGKDVTRRHLQVFILGSAVVGVAGAMLTTLDGQFTPTTYTPLRYTFIILVMVIVGGSGNNAGSILGAFLIWFVWIEAETAGRAIMGQVVTWLPDGSALGGHLLDAAPHLRLLLMGLILLLVLRFSPRGLIPERRGRSG